ncbi:MAG TPA: FecR family protein [Verrucomicrobiae bacterium]|nr:FecR family protein [Verrucomicrobiae bacterium]
MKKTIALSLYLTWLTVVPASPAADFKQSKVTQVVNEVQIISGADQATKSATVNDLFSLPDILRTGPASRAELVAQDDTVTRVGANTIFSFDPARRTVDLKQGSLLFHSPHGKGGGSIHTGSATASVLGSTLIVSATPNGGFKVISLEDDVTIKLPNGLHQQLKPGQMTFILPGGTRLAPIILFRLDDLTQHSLLVNGFVHPLASLPLIDHEINRQNKLLKSGKLADTGLLAGNNATSDQVEVLDANTVQYAVNPQDVQAALGADATINQPSLLDANIPTPPARIFMNPAFSLPDNSFFDGQKFTGFAAKNISINTPGSNPNGLTVNLSPYAGKPEFDFVASKGINIEGSVNFNGLSANNTLALIGGEQITFAPNVAVQANVGDFQIASAGALTLDSVALINQLGGVSLASGSTISLENTTTIDSAGGVTLSAPDSVNLSSDGFVVTGFNHPVAGHYVGLSGPTTIITDAGSGQVTLSSSSASVAVVDTDIQAHFLTLNSGDSILLDASGHTLSATGPGATASFTAPNLVSVYNADLAAYGAVNMAANTINLINVAFGAGSTVSLQSLNGVLAPNPNTGAVSVPGAVNFINNVTYGGNPAQNYVNNGGGITISKLH